MYRRLYILFFFIICPLTILYSQNVHKPFTIPEVISWKSINGKTKLSNGLVYNQPTPKYILEVFKTDYFNITNNRLLFHKKAIKGDIILQLNKKLPLEDEAYILTINNTITISARTEVGLYWGTRTLLQLINNSPIQLSLNNGKIYDQPQYKIRGLMLDVARKFIPIYYLKNLVEIMSYYKMNTLQLHLNDNGFKQFFNNKWSETPSDFRLECSTYPGLTSKQFYTKKEFIELQNFANKYHINIIPEIDIPAHSLAFTKYKPSIASSLYGKDHLDLFKKETYFFLDTLFQEYLNKKNPVFLGKIINIGTDEYSNKDSAVTEQFRLFTNHYIHLIKKYNKTPMLWGTLTHAHGKVAVDSDGVLMSIWNNYYAQPLEMKKQGFKIISIPDVFNYIVPLADYYHDYLDIKWLYNNWTPAIIGDIKIQEKDPSLYGGMFAVWNDFYGNGISTKDIHYRIIPALQTISTKCWTGIHTSISFSKFDSLRHQVIEAPSINELGNIKSSIYIDTLKKNTTNLNHYVTDIGFNHLIEFIIDCKHEKKGTILTKSQYGILYLSDPKFGLLGFKRDGYLNTFNFKLPTSGKYKLKFILTPTKTILFCNDKKQETLSIKTYYSFDSFDQIQLNESNGIQPNVYKLQSQNKINYIQTMFFPFKETGIYNSIITKFTVKKYNNLENL